MPRRSLAERLRRPLWAVTVSYAVFASLWIYFSDAVLGLFVRDPDRLLRISVYKGLAFVAVTATLLGLLMHRFIGRVVAAEAAERQRHDALMAGQQRILEGVAQGGALPAALDQIVRFIEAQAPEMLCSILLLDADGTHVRHGAAPSLPREYVEAIDGLPIGPVAGSCGTAAYTREPVYVEDIENDPRWVDYKQPALLHGLRASWSTPIFDADGRVLGTFAMYYQHRALPSVRHRQLIEVATQLASIAIARSRREEEGRAQEEQLRELNASLEARVEARTQQLRSALLRAESADRLKSAFLATMSHELRTPLNSIIGFTGILLQQLPGPLSSEQQRQLEMVRGSARHLLSLINDVLDLSKIEAGQLEVSAEEFALAPLLERLVATMRPQAERKGLALRLDASEAPTQMHSDPRRVEQVLLNLLSNAIKFTERGTVSLRAVVLADFRREPGASPAAAVRFTVQDSGIGIAERDLATLFLPFRQIDSGLSRRHEGTGLGLSICRRLCELLGGDISVVSEPGVGSTFSVILPLHLEAAT